MRVWMRHLGTVATTCALMLGSAGGLALAVPLGPGDASAAPPPDSREALVSVLADATPGTIQRAAAITPSTDADVAISYSSEQSVVEVPTDPADGITVSDDDGGFHVSLPSGESAELAVPVSAGIVAYDNTDGSSTVPIVLEDGSVQINTIIESKNAPTQFRYEFALPAGSSLEAVPGGSVFLYDAEDGFVGGLAPAWAKDSDGRNVPTRYEIRGNAVVQVVEHTNGFTYPVVADPWLGFNLFSYVRNDVRPAYKSKPVYTMELSAWGQLVYRGSAALGLATVPMGVGLSVASTGYKIMTNDGWAEVISRQPKAATTSIKQQYVCHVRYGYPVLALDGAGTLRLGGRRRPTGRRRC